MQAMLLAGKTAVVTGAASGIGQAIASAFVAEGAYVVVADINAVAGEAVAAALGANARFFRLDVASEAGWVGLDELLDAGGLTLDIMVNNAGINVPGSIEILNIHDWERMSRVNVGGVILGCKLAVARMREAGTSGSIINLASAAAIKASALAIGYSATKAAILRMTQDLALYCCLEKLPIRCNAINPGLVDTPIIAGTIDLMGGGQAGLAALGHLTPMGMIGRPDDIAAAAVFLASDQARYMTGSAVTVDGGMAIS